MSDAHFQGLEKFVVLLLLAQLGDQLVQDAGDTGIGKFLFESIEFCLCRGHRKIPVADGWTAGPLGGFVREGHSRARRYASTF
jgi:hypothetical protein